MLIEYSFICKSTIFIRNCAHHDLTHMRVVGTKIYKWLRLYICKNPPESEIERAYIAISLQEENVWTVLITRCY